jgi:sucrose-6F-phosphate phosphohydrolase
MNSLLVCDLDGTLVGDRAGLERFIRLVTPLRGGMGLAYATGRSAVSAAGLLSRHGLPAPDVLIAEVGAAVHWPPDWRRDPNWSGHLAHNWNAARVRSIANGIKGLASQPPANQSPYKCSYELGAQDAPHVLASLEAALRAAGQSVRTIYSSGRDLDLLPAGADKGLALAYVLQRLGVPSTRVLTCGDSGNDLALLKHGGPAALVGNAGPELRSAAPASCYRARGNCAAGVIEAMQHFGWLDK